MRINHNIAALNTFRQLSSNSVNGAKSLERLSSGLRINKAGDDAAGLAISEKMRGQIRGLDQASSNAQNGISLLQTAEGALNETHSILQRMRELAVQSSTDTNTSTDRAEIQKEVDQLASEITRIANTTEFNTQTLLNGGVKSTGVGAMTFQIGANAGQNLGLSINAMDAKALGVSRDVATGQLSGATKVTSTTISGTLGTGVTNGAALTLSAAVSTPGTVATGGANGGITWATADNSITLNGWTINVVDGAAAGAATVSGVDTVAKSINLAVNDDNGDNTAAAAINTALNDALAANGINDVQFAVTGTVTDNLFNTDQVVTLAGGADDIVTLTLTGAAGAETVDVNGRATSASFTDAAKYKGITVGLDGNLSSGAAGAAATTVAATITVSATYSSEATFLNSAKTADAVAAAGIDVSSQSAANTAITSIQSAIETVSSERSKLGSLQNRFEHTIANLGTSSENLTAAESRIRDVDMAKEMMEFTKNNILSQAAQAMLAQANQQPQGVLQLLR
ncbi:MAG: hypothetical protein VR72_20135 [Clostridiaceae bacterium BRH_c20a]|nr:MAG: hypothetical protein VR72_20135 [Clostridiaceae bacterium BRH_c20a]